MWISPRLGTRAVGFGKPCHGDGYRLKAESRQLLGLRPAACCSQTAATPAGGRRAVVLQGQIKPCQAIRRCSQATDRGSTLAVERCGGLYGRWEACRSS